MNLSARKIGIALIVISIVLAVVLFVLQYNTLMLGRETCPAIIEGKPCPYHQENPFTIFIIFSALIAAVFVIGLFFIFYYGKEEQKAIKKIEEKETEEKSKERFVFKEIMILLRYLMELIIFKAAYSKGIYYIHNMPQIIKYEKK